jgi:tetratricopeptide (TPR) repeat protein
VDDNGDLYSEENVDVQGPIAAGGQVVTPFVVAPLEFRDQPPHAVYTFYGLVDPEFAVAETNKSDNFIQLRWWVISPGAARNRLRPYWTSQKSLSRRNERKILSGKHLRPCPSRSIKSRVLERALAIREKSLGPEHPDTATSLNNLAALLRDQGDLAGTRPLLERALAIREKVLGPEHPDTATSLNNLAALLRDQGDLAAARPLFERALAIQEKVLGHTHPDTNITRSNLADLLLMSGQPSEALALSQSGASPARSSAHALTSRLRCTAEQLARSAAE